jgi:RNA polymerase primary sigma factor
MLEKHKFYAFEELHEESVESALELEVDEHDLPEQDLHFDEAIKLYMRDVQKTRLLTADEEKELAARIAAGDRSATNRMIESNLRLVVKVAKRYVNRGLPFLDLIEEGNLGLIRAVAKFRTEKECRFSTYAIWWIRQSIERALTNQVRTIRLPIHVADEVNRMHRINNELVKKMDREPSNAELATAMNSNPTHINKLQVLVMKTYSIERPVADDNDYSLIDTIEDEMSPSPDDIVCEKDWFNAVREGIATLSDTERQVLMLRFGLEDTEPQTLDDIGRGYGVSRERIRQIESRALAKLRLMSEERELPGNQAVINA